MARIALDAMGGDHAPQATVAGALLAVAELDPAHSVVLVGRSAIIEQTLDEALRGEHAALATFRDRLRVVDAPEIIEMAEKPSAAIRAKPNSSMMVGLRMHAEGACDAFVSAGNTGAQMAASMVLLRLYEGLKRPAIVTIFPTAEKPVVVLDAGANVDCSAAELVQFARLGAVYAHDMLGRANPAVGLLNIGEEAEKGNAVTKEAHALLAQSGLHFVGNVEGRDLPAGHNHQSALDVVVCDGFVGNAILKFYEAVAPLMVGLLVKAGLPKDRIMGALRQLDYSEYGGAPLLGVRGVSIICHGRSSPRAIASAIKVAVQAVDNHLAEHIGKRLAGPEGAAGATA
ncbi:MAG TPA: phosphate acyltransferase PlsX [Gemmatimonadaceae bacterium]|nr:phosphate acyltransferase PlsX [Gemmatimonadaceae bacterium]